MNVPMDPVRIVRSTADVSLVADSVAGDAELPTVVLLHGLTQQRKFWGPVIRRLTSRPDHPPVLAVDQRGHGDADKPDHGPYDVATCTADVARLLDQLSIDRCVVVGHSWGGWIAVELAAQQPDRVVGMVALDGGFTRLADLGEREAVRTRLTPPRLGIPLDDLLERISTGPLAPWWSDEMRDALLPTFEVDDEGLARTRLGFDRHMQVLDGALDYDPVVALEAIACPAWMVRCEPVGTVEPDAALLRAAGLLAMPRVLRWAGAVHDVPLQWPALVAGVIESCVDEVGAAERPDGRGDA
ncbi:MAG: alpha/beta hydrolase [Actinobacteria bacterium]|nr:alpha/beta hydrolase [Actinomycetota bacterium]